MNYFKSCRGAIMHGTSTNLFTMYVRKKESMVQKFPLGPLKHSQGSKHHHDHSWTKFCHEVYLFMQACQATCGWNWQYVRWQGNKPSWQLHWATNCKYWVYWGFVSIPGFEACESKNSFIPRKSEKVFHLRKWMCCISSEKQRSGTNSIKILRLHESADCWTHCIQASLQIIHEMKTMPIYFDYVCRTRLKPNAGLQTMILWNDQGSSFMDGNQAVLWILAKYKWRLQQLKWKWILLAGCKNVCPTLGTRVRLDIALFWIVANVGVHYHDVRSIWTCFKLVLMLVCMSDYNQGSFSIGFWLGSCQGPSPGFTSHIQIST